MPKRKAGSNAYASKRRKTMYRRKTATQKLAGLRRNAFTKKIKRTILKMAEPKHICYSHGKTEVYHNAGEPTGVYRYLPNPIILNGNNQMPGVGTSDKTRNGDQIYGTGIAVNLLLGQKQDRHNVTWRIMVLKISPSEKPTQLDDFIENTSGNILLDSVNTDRGKIVYQKYIKHRLDPDAGTAGKEYTFTHRIFIKNRQLYKFTKDADKLHENKIFYVYVFAYDAYGTLLSDNIGYVQGWTKFYYRDP